MDNGFSILMLIFAAALLLYAAILAIIKDYKMLPYRARVSVYGILSSTKEPNAGV